MESIRRRRRKDFLLNLLLSVASFCSTEVEGQQQQEGEGLIVWSVVEESTVGVFIGDIRRHPSSSVVRQMPNSDTRFTLLSKPNQDMSSLSFDDMTGVMLTSSIPIDRETLCHAGGRKGRSEEEDCYMDISVAFIHSLQLIQVMAIRLQIVDINDNSPVFYLSAIQLSASESSAVGTSIALPVAHDSDGVQFGVGGYSMQPEFPELSLNVSRSSSGIILPYLVVKSGIDREVTSSYHFRLTAADVDGLNGTTDVTLAVDDINDNPPRFIQSQFTVRFREDVPVVDDVIFVATATDADAGNNGVLDYGFDVETATTHGRRFVINQTNGEVTLIQTLDYEQQSEMRLRIQATDHGVIPLTGEMSLVVKVTDANDNRPQVTVSTVNGSQVQSQVSEHQSPGVFVAHLSVYDPDNDGNDHVTCRLMTQTEWFHLERLIEGQYKLITGAMLNYTEQSSTYSVSIICSDAAEPPLSTEVSLTIDVLDLNDHDPEFSESQYNVSIVENNDEGVVLIMCTATDRDSNLNGQLTFSLLSDSSSDALRHPMFFVSVDRHRCVVTATRSFDYEELNRLEFTVRAQDHGHPPRFSLAKVVVDVVDVNDESPVFVRSFYHFELSENQPPGSLVGHVSANDLDSRPFDEFLFALSDSNTQTVRERVDVDPWTGAITTKTALDREERSTYTFKVRVFDVNSTEMEDIATIELLVKDENDNFPEIRSPLSSNITLDASLDISPGDVIFQVEADDRDEAENASLTFALLGVSQQRFFSIDENTGVVKLSLKTTPMFYADRLYPMTVAVSDRGKPPRMTSFEVLIEVTDQGIEGQVTANTEATLIGVIGAGISAASVCLLLLLIILLKMRHRRRFGSKDLARSRFSRGRGAIYSCRAEELKFLRGNMNNDALSSYPCITSESIGCDEHSQRNLTESKTHIDPPSTKWTTNDYCCCCCCCATTAALMSDMTTSVSLTSVANPDNVLGMSDPPSKTDNGYSVLEFGRTLQCEMIYATSKGQLFNGKF